MKYLHPSLLFMVCALFALTSAAQTKVKPEIIYSTQPQKYVVLISVPSLKLIARA